MKKSEIYFISKQVNASTAGVGAVVLQLALPYAPASSITGIVPLAGNIFTNDASTELFPALQGADNAYMIVYASTAATYNNASVALTEDWNVSGTYPAF